MAASKRAPLRSMDDIKNTIESQLDTRGIVLPQSCTDALVNRAYIKRAAGEVSKCFLRWRGGPI